jgi:hypothetical protein
VNGQPPGRWEISRPPTRNSGVRQPGPSCPPTRSFTWPLSGLMPLDDPPDRLGCRATQLGGPAVAAHLAVGGDDVHPFPRSLQWGPLGGVVTGWHRHHHRSGAHAPKRHDQRGVGTSTWPPAGTCTWPPAGTFSWPRTWPRGHPRQHPMTSRLPTNLRDPSRSPLSELKAADR